MPMLEKFYKLTNPQKSIWNVEKFFEGTTINNICASITILDDFDEKILEKAIRDTVSENSNFQIKLTIQNNLPVQYFSEPDAFDIETIHLKKTSEFEKIKEDLMNYPFHLLNSHLFCFKILRFPDGHGMFLFTVHHIIADSWALGLFAKSIMQKYKFLMNKEPLPAKEEHSYIEYIQSEEAYFSSKKYNNDKTYWKNLFENIPEPVTFPSTKTISKNTDNHSKRETFRVSFDVLKNIKNFCAQNNISVFHFFMAIYSMYLAKVSSEEEIVLGTPILNRTNFKEKNTMGMFVNTIPVKLSIQQNEYFSDLVHKVSINMLNYLKHQKYSYSQILEDLRDTNPSLSKLYNVVLSYQITKAVDKENGNYETDWYQNKYSFNDCNIHITDINDTGELFIHYDYLCEKYNQDDILYLHRRIIYMMKQVLENSNISIDNISLLPQEEEIKILNDFNNNFVRYSLTDTIIDLFETQVSKNPNNIAIAFENQTITYKGLNERVNKFANYLKKNYNMKQGCVIPVIMPRSIDLIVSMLAIIKTGCAYLPITPETPTERINYIIQNSNAPFVITDNDFKFAIKSVCYSKINYSNYDNHNLNTKINVEDMIYVIYTSGSTGNPKGVKVCHKNLKNFIYSFQHLYGNITQQDRLLASTSISFDVSIFELFMPLLNGAQLHLYNEHNITDIFKYCQKIYDEKITFAYIPPNILDAVYHVLATYQDLALNKLLLGVEPIKSKIVEQFFKLNPNLKIVNAYGPTETTICATAVLVDNDIIENYEILPIGKPLDNLKIFILDKNLNPVPIGMSGEMYITGYNVSNGYLNQQDLTKQAFVQLPNLNCALAYKTGDLAKWDYHGIINFIGRNDNQIKLSGHRIELGEIEKQIYSYPNIVKTIVSLDKNQKLNCYFIADKKIDIADLKSFLLQKLPNYSIPHLFMQVNNFELTSNGKIDRKKLPEIIPEHKNHQIMMPRNNVDTQLIQILQSILKVKDISINDSFLELGGDSLSAINLCVAIQEEFHVKLLVKDVINSSKISDISDMILHFSEESENKKISPIAKKPVYPVSSAQKRMYISSKLAGPDSILYNIPGGLILNHKPDIAKIEKCFQLLIHRHESFRTSFEMVENSIVQKISKHIDFKLNTIENAEFSELDRLFHDFVKPFDLSKAPLLRSEFIEFTNHKYMILIDMHHIISDGVSMNIFADEFCKLYNDDTLEPLEVTYKDYAVFENERELSKEYKKAKEYWLNQFQDDIPVLNMPTTYPRPSIQSYEGSRISSTIPAKTVEKIDYLSKELNVTPYMILLSCYYILLSKYNSGQDFVVGSPVIGRDMPQTSNIIGMFVNTLALRCKIDSSSSFAELLQNVKNIVLNGYDNQIYPFDELVSQLEIKRDASRSPLFDTMFIYQNEGYKEFNLGNIKAKYYTPSTNISKFDLSLEVIPENDGFHLLFEYATSLFTDEFIQNFSEHYLNILNTILKNKDIQIFDIDILTKKETSIILNDFNNTNIDYPKNKTILQLFEEQVARHPEKNSVIFENQKITYKELNEKANALANYLLSKNIKNDSIISILLDRSPNIVVCIYAVMKAGASYVVIDNDFPKERIDYIVQDSGSNFTITNQFLNQFPFEQYSKNNLEIEENHRLCIIYTSGSTGKPKGVLLHKEGYYNLIHAFDTDFGLSNFQNILSIATVSFDMFAFEVFAATLLGNTLVLANVEEQKNPIAMSHLIKKHHVDFIVTTPSRAELLLLKECENPLKDVKAILLGGEKFTANLYNRLKTATKARIFNSYGPTEITSACTNKLITSEEITIGKPIANTKIYICDSKLHLLPIGVIGEICVGGKGVTDGYLNNEKITSEHFVKNPFDEGFLYRTGDLGKYRTDGELEYIDRADDQIKIRGLRIELGEIESLILKYPNIRNVTVIKQTINNREFLSAYYIANKKIITSDLRKYLSKFLPKYMIPSYYIALDNFQYTQNGKIDKKALPLPTGVLSISKENYIAPTTELQSKLVSIWEKILNIKPIGINDNFFELGGDSLLAMSLNMELLKITSKISYSDIFHFSTIAELEEKINSTESKPLFNKIENLPEKYEDILHSTIQKSKIQKFTPEGILLTGATGFLGIHILEEFLNHTENNIFCIVREQPGITVATKLIQKLNYYFGNKYDSFINKRIFVVSGNVAEPGFGLDQEQLLYLANSVNVVINCAANVSHFGNYQEFYKTNVVSTKHMIDFCQSFNKKLYHISTTGVSGSELDLSYLKSKKNHHTNVDFNESSLYIGQILDNVYTRSKFEAESCVLNALNSGLDGYILRMGNLMPRYSDGGFQENINDNAFLNKFASFVKAGIMPKYMLKHMLNFTPVDYAANAVYKLVTHPSKTNRIFHIYNCKNISVKKYLKKTNFKITILSEEDFVNHIKEILQNEFAKDSIKNLLDDFDKNLHLNYVSDIITRSKFTTNYLRKINFRWPNISKKYIRKFDNILRRVIE